MTTRHFFTPEKNASKSIKFHELKFLLKAVPWCASVSENAAEQLTFTDDFDEAFSQASQRIVEEATRKIVFLSSHVLQEQPDLLRREISFLTDSENGSTVEESIANSSSSSSPSNDGSTSALMGEDVLPATVLLNDNVESSSSEIKPLSKNEPSSKIEPSSEIKPSLSSSEIEKLGKEKYQTIYSISRVYLDLLDQAFLPSPVCYRINEPDKDILLEGTSPGNMTIRLGFNPQCVTSKSGLSSGDHPWFLLLSAGSLTAVIPYVLLVNEVLRSVWVLPGKIVDAFQKSDTPGNDTPGNISVENAGNVSVENDTPGNVSVKNAILNSDPISSSICKRLREAIDLALRKDSAKEKRVLKKEREVSEIASLGTD